MSHTVLNISMIDSNNVNESLASGSMLLARFQMNGDIDIVVSGSGQPYLVHEIAGVSFKVCSELDPW